MHAFGTPQRIWTWLAFELKALTSTCNTLVIEATRQVAHTTGVLSRSLRMYFDVIARGRRPYGLSMFQNIWCFRFQEDFVIQNLLDVGRTWNLTPEIGRPFSSA